MQFSFQASSVQSAVSLSASGDRSRRSRHSSNSGNSSSTLLNQSRFAASASTSDFSFTTYVAQKELNSLLLFYFNKELIIEVGKREVKWGTCSSNFFVFLCACLMNENPDAHRSIFYSKCSTNEGGSEAEWTRRAPGAKREKG